MFEMTILGLFCAGLLFCVVSNISVVYALLFGLLLFLFYGRVRGLSWKKLLQLLVSGISDVKNILIVFALVGMLTAVWRCAGTIPVIICSASKLLQPAVFLPMVFLLNSLISVLTGTSFGTSATMGVICATVGNAMHMNIVWVGAAILSGIYVGDRISPISSCALLIANITGTEIYQNVKSMLRSGAAPFLLTTLAYFLIGLLYSTEEVTPNLQILFEEEFTLHWIGLLPAAAILILSVLRRNVKFTMGVSILLSILVYLFLQHGQLSALPSLLISGYHASSSELGAMIDGGGILSMVKVGIIVCISSAYSGLFRETALLQPVRRCIQSLATRTTPYTAMFFTSIAACMIACNQSLAVIMSHQLCGDTLADASEEALALEDTVPVIAPMIPWSIASAVPLQTIGAPAICILFSFFLYLLPLSRLLSEIRCKKKFTLSNMQAADQKT